MEAMLESQKLLLFVVFVFPGLVSLHVYRLMMPTRTLKWESAILEGLFYSLLNFVLCFPIWELVAANGMPPKHPVWLWLEIAIIFVVGPIVWPFLYLKMVRSGILSRHLQSP